MRKNKYTILLKKVIHDLEVQNWIAITSDFSKLILITMLKGRIERSLCLME